MASGSEDKPIFPGTEDYQDYDRENEERQAGLSCMVVCQQF